VFACYKKVHTLESIFCLPTLARTYHLLACDTRAINQVEDEERFAPAGEQPSIFYSPPSEISLAHP
jgi:hypothetical protein